MVFSNSVFLFLFLPVVLFGYYVLPHKSYATKNIWLCLASLFFYAWGEPLYVFIMLLSIMLNYGMGILIYKEKGEKLRKLFFLIICLFNIGTLVLFKYAKWFLNMFGILSTDSRLRNLTLPIGISFYTFQALSYVIDVYKGKTKAQKSILDLGLYIAFFPQLVAGPIVKYDEIEEQLKKRNESMELFSEGAHRFIIGLSKKVLLANMLSVLADRSFFATAEQSTAILAWAGSFAFTLQIYFDFSGYSDMAIGLGKMFGFEICENFNYPYLSQSIKEFWVRWHMSLGQWFREYIYIPLGGNRKGRLRKYLNIMVVFLVSGFWHGASWTFVLWGILNGVIQVLEDIIGIGKKNRNGICKISAIFATLFITNHLWVLFKAATIKDALIYYMNMYNLSGNGLVNYYAKYWILQYKWVLVAAMIFQFPVVKYFWRKICLFVGEQLSNTISNIVMMLLLIIDICYVVGSGYNPFLYFNF